MKILLLILIFSFSLYSAQSQTKRVLFIGNSYTYVNNLPQMTLDVALSTGDSLYFDSNAIGGATFYSHSINTVTRSKIMAGNWNYVVLQGQSLELWGNFPDILSTLPQVVELDSLINYHSTCVETMFYQTWGRKNGFGTYSYLTMDSMIHVNYMKLADSLDAVVSPVGEAWKYIRQQYPSIELYDPDESHPSLAGTYAAACCFYTALFRKDPTLITFNSSLNASDAANIRTAVKLVVYDSLLHWHIGEYDSLMNPICLLSVSDISTNDIIKISPNPFSTHTTITFGETQKNITIVITDLLGKEIKAIPNIRDRQVVIEKGEMKAGIYFVHAIDEHKNSSNLKIIVQ